MVCRQIICVLFLPLAALPGRLGQAADDVRGLEFFEKRVRPLLAERCFECHGAEKQEADLRLDRPAAIASGGASGVAVVAGKPAASLLITAVSYQDADLQMPPDRKLSAAEINDLRRWVEIGAPGVQADERPVAENGRSSRRSEAATFWAFQPPPDPELPATGDSLWPRSPIDRFVFAGLQRAGLAPAPRADRRTLIRRATFDLTGLPPTPAEVQAFLADDAPDAFAKVIDRLLASPHYGERWGRHWLDVARYADSNGLDENVAHGNAWRYRDYVISAFNRDKPYDRFVQEQIAGDLLPGGDRALQNERLIATGFLSLGPKVLAEVDERKMEMDIIDEQIDTLGKAFLGLTLGCARCHDHKFDPITTEDYYALAGIFKSTRTMENFTKIARWNESALWSAEYEEQRQRHAGQVTAAKQSVEALVAQANEQLREQLGAAAQFPAQPEQSYPQETRDKLTQLREQLAKLEKSPPQPPTAMGVGEGQAADVQVHLRGSHLTLGKRVPRRFPAALAGKEQPALGAAESGRLPLARWLTSPNHPLTARVMVNRIWRWHFGRGLVATPDNFGQLGERPVNQELLDWLSVRFVQSGWSVKSMHRLLMLSSTYQMRSRHDERAARIDPENRLLWRANVRRLDAEQFRDSLLAVSGILDRTLGGSLLTTENRKHIFDHTSKDQTAYDVQRRSVYLPVVRNHLHAAFALFDYADASVPNGDRNGSTVASQALYVMNSDFVAASGNRLASRLAELRSDHAERIRLLYETIYARPPAASEIERLLRVLDAASLQADGGASKEKGQRRAWQLICHALLAANEFIYVR